MVALLAVAIAMAPAAWAFRVQTAAIIATFALFRVLPWHGKGSLLGLALPVFIAGFAWAFPIRNKRTRLTFIVAATAALPFVFAGLTAIAAPKMVTWMISRDLVLWIVIVEYVGRQATRPRFVDVQRAVFSNFYFNAAPLPIEDTQRVDRSPRILLLGGVWVASGLALRALTEHFAVWPNPIRAFADGRIALGFAESLVAALFLTVVVGWRTFLNAGIARLYGMPIRAPIDRPWLVTNFLEYWRRMNVHNYKVLNEVYFRNFVPMRGWWMPIGVFAVFALSGLEHMWRVGYSGHMAWRWLIDGLVSAATAAWLQSRAPARARAYLQSRQTPRPVHNIALRRAYQVAAVLLTFAAHGVLLQLSWAWTGWSTRGGMLFPGGVSGDIAE